jgi:hypothetical protein
MKQLTKSVALVAFALLANACMGPQVRYLTAMHAHAPSSTYYIAYAERPAIEAHVLACTVQQDNTPVCRPQPAIDQLLNAPAH